MRAEGWKTLILDAVHEADNGESEELYLLAKYLEMCDEAKQELRNKGYGWIGLDILETVKQEVQHAEIQMNYLELEKEFMRSPNGGLYFALEKEFAVIGFAKWLHDKAKR